MKKIFPSFLVLMLALFIDSSLNAMQFNGEFPKLIEKLDKEKLTSLQLAIVSSKLADYQGIMTVSYTPNELIEFKFPGDDGEFCISWTASGKVTNAHRVNKVFIPPCTHRSHVTAAEETIFLTLEKAGLR